MVDSGGRDAPLLSSILNSPYSAAFVPPPAETPKELADYLTAMQIKLYDQVVDIPYRGLQRNLRLLVKKYGLNMVQRGMVLAINTSEHPFSTAYIEKMIKRLQETQPFNYKK